MSRLTYLDSAMVEIPAVLAQLSSQYLTADNLFVKHLEVDETIANTIDAQSITTVDLDATHITNVDLTNDYIQTIDIVTGDINTSTAEISIADIGIATIGQLSANQAQINTADITNLTNQYGFIQALTATSILTNTLTSLSLSSGTGTFNELTTREFYVDRIHKKIANTLYVSNAGSDTNEGTNIFNPFKTIKKACEVAHNARTAAIYQNLTRQKRDLTLSNGANALNNIQICFDTITSLISTNTSTPITFTSTGVPAASGLIASNLGFLQNYEKAFVINEYPTLAAKPGVLNSCESDLRYILSAVCIDITNGNNNTSILYGQRFWNNGVSVLSAGQIIPAISALKYVKTLITNYIIVNRLLPVTDTADTKFTIFVGTGDYTENNPVYVPPNASIIGDNLRRTTIRPLNRQQDIFWLDNSTYIWGVTFRSHFSPCAAVAFPDSSVPRLSSIAFRNLAQPTSGWIRPYIVTSPYTQGSSSITAGLSSNLQGTVKQVFNNVYTGGVQASAVTDACFETVTDIMLYGLSGSAPYTGASTTGAPAASALITINTDFIKAEVGAFVSQQYPSLLTLPPATISGSLSSILDICKRDVGYILSAVCIDIKNGNNVKSIESGKSYWNNVISKLPDDQIAPTISTVQFAQRLAKYVAKNEPIPVLQAGMGMRVDGSKVEGFLRSMVLDSFTQFNENGHGIYVLNNGYAQLVSIFTICCDQGVRVESGGVVSISTSNSSFGLSGVVAIGKSPSPLLSGVITHVKTTVEDPSTTKTVTMTGVTPLIIYPDSPYYPAYKNNPLIGVDTRYITFKPYDNLVFTCQTGNNGDLYTIADNPTLTAINGQQAYIININERTPITTLAPGNSAAFFLRSTAYPSSHTFEFIGSGAILKEAVPALGGLASVDNEVCYENGGAVFYTSTNHTGDFYIGKDFRVVQATGTIEGDTFKRSILTLVSPLNLALS